ncbi:CPBP family intramembrane glutamic endopeptidase [Chitinophaga eiseniae]|uniref:CPBP family intramembrane metalloprotease n=1 Tax=Chitinophaga eiseniae TaxID=634771 RepID=A0A847SNN1_9BACT|nr:type II CAAX endopeptidase family protein [Chitinophaga eiseniae]NLR79026.1 CPBP family intramembrane metalloprotease [Chitinophaga eiseniae]
MIGYLKQSPILLQFLTFFGFFFGFSALYVVGIQSLTPTITGQSLDALQRTLDPNFVGYLKIIQLAYTIIAFIVPAAIFAYLWQPYPMSYLGLKLPSKAILWVLALLAMFGVLPLSGALGEWNQSWQVPQSVKDMEALAEKLLGVMLKMPTIKDLFINLILVAIIPAIGEELFFRGVLQRLIINATGKVWLSIFITAVIFSAIHMEILAFVPRVLLGFALGAIYVISGNLWLAIGAHVLNNGLQVVMLYLFQHGIVKEDPQADSHIEWYYVALSIPVTIGLFWALKQKSPAGAMITGENKSTVGEVDEIGKDGNL